MQPKQIINAIFDSVNYTEKFEQDIVESEKMVVISSPDIRQDKIDRFLLLIKKRQEVGGKGHSYYNRSGRYYLWKIGCML